MDVTAVVLSADDYQREWPGIKLLVHRCIFRTAEEFQSARFDAVLKVDTEFFFFLDDDDDLPADYLRVIDLCMGKKKALVYTDEIIRIGGEDRIRHSKPYSQLAHYHNVMLVHHLVLCKTRESKDIIHRLPRGPYYPELMLHWELAKLGTAYVREVGYVWTLRPDGVHTWPAILAGYVNTKEWAKADMKRSVHA